MPIPIVNHSLKYNPSLDGLRGIAIALVVLFHIWPEYFSFGYVGVDIFFVLSGYLITQIIHIKLQKGTFSFREFYRNRIRRIFPAMIIVLLTTFFIGYLFLFPSELQQLGKHITSSAFFYQNFRLIDEVGYWDKAAQLKPLLHFWSLSIEEQFYVVWPFLIFVLYRFRVNLFLSLLLIVLILFLLPFILDIHPFYHSLARFWELAFGGLLYAAYQQFSFRQLSQKLQWIILLLFFISITLAFDNTTFSINRTLAIVVSTGFIIVLISKDPYHKLFSSKPLVILGLISFPLYLWHYVFISYAHIFGLNVSHYGTALIILSIGLSYLTYRYIELYSRRQQSYRFAAALFATVILIGLLGQYTYIHKGFPDRSFLHSNEAFKKQFVRTPPTDQMGLSLITKVLGHKPRNNYVKASSNNTDKKFIAVIGDSHAHTSYPGFAKLAKEHGYEALLLANSSCPPYIDGVMGKNEKDLKECQEKIDDIYAVLHSNLQIEKIIFATRGPVYIYGIGYGIVESGGKPLHYHFKNFFTQPYDYNQTDTFFNVLQKTFQTFKNTANIDFYYLIENPELGFSPKNCITRPFNLFPSTCRLPLKSYLKRAGNYRSYLLSIVKSYSNIHLLDPMNLYCDDSYCYAVKNGKMLYADDDHHSIDGSQMQAKYFEAEIFQ